MKNKALINSLLAILICFIISLNPSCALSSGREMIKKDSMTVNVSLGGAIMTNLREWNGSLFL